MNQATGGGGFAAFIPIIFIGIFVAIVANLLAREKGRNITLWTVIGLIPVVNLLALWFFIGAANLRLESKIDELLGK